MDRTPWQPDYQHRAVVYGTKGVIASASPLAAAAGLHVLQAGGNAVDAAVAIAAVECVTMSMMCGLGGEPFVLVGEPDGSVHAFGGSGVAPYAIDVEAYRRRGPILPQRGVESVSVPGEVAAWDSLLERFGTMPLDQLIAPAIDAAEMHPVGQGNASHIARMAELLARDLAAAAVYLPNGRPLRPGEPFRQPDLARVLRAIAKGGSETFYRGPIAEAIVGTLQAGGSAMTLQEFADHRTDTSPPIRTRYRGYEVFQTPPPSQGAIVLEMLNLLDGFDLASPLDAATIHLMTEAKKIAYADRIAALGDPRFVASQVDRLIDPAYAARRRLAIDPNRAMPAAAEPAREGATTSFVVADGSGRMVSYIHSLSNAGGSGVVAEGTGILLNNRVGRGFSLEEGHPNVLAGGKRTMHTLNTYLIQQDGRPIIAGNTPGGDGQPQWNVQVIANLIDFGMNVQQAAEWPRWVHLPGTDPVTLGETERLGLDGRYPAELADTLARLGHPVQRLAAWQPEGGVQLIRRDLETGVFSAGSDARAGGLAIGL